MIWRSTKLVNVLLVQVPGQKIKGGADIENGSFVPSDMNATMQVILEH